jgi:AraC-like DNA-binding protein
MFHPDLPSPNLSLFLPPYDAFTGIGELSERCERGAAIVWSVFDATSQWSEFEWLASRPARMPLIILLPPPAGIDRALPLLREAGSLYPRGVLPNSGGDGPEAIRLLLGSAPRDLAGVVIMHLTREGVLRDQKIRGLARRVFELAPVLPSITQLARKLYTSRRTLGRHFEAEGLPVPSHWLQFARLLHVATVIQEKQQLPIFKAAVQVGYPDGFTMSNQMKRLIGCRPTDVRENLGLGWIIEEWVRREAEAGRLRWPVQRKRPDDVKAWLERGPARRVG